MGAARARDEPRIAEAHHELLEIGPREVLLGRDLGEADAGPCPRCRPSWTMSRTPYSPLVENETAPLPWNAGRVDGR